VTNDGQEADWVRRSQAGDARAFGRLVERYRDRLLTAVTRSLGSRSPAEDIVQETFLRAFQAIGRFRGQASFYTWLYRIAFNLVLSRHRRRSRRPDLRGSPPMEQMEAKESVNPQARAEVSEQQERVTRAVAELEETFRLALVLRDIEGMDYRQIGEVLNVPVGTVKSRIHRARMELKEKLRDLL